MNLFEFIRNSLQIENVVSNYTALKRMGGYLKGSCPFHSEKTASFTVTPHKGIFYCFGCHASGDVVGFIARIEQCTQIEAAKIIVERFGLQIPEQLQQQLHQSPTQTADRQRYFLLMECLRQWLSQELSTQSSAINYLRDRGLDSNIILQYGLGFFPAGPEGLKRLSNWLTTKNFLLQELVDHGVLVQKGRQLYSPFEDRILFPIYDSVGRCCAFGGRIFIPQDDRSKYYNSRENDYFTKGSLLYGLAQAKIAMQSSQEAFLVEGYMDCLAMIQHGYPQTVATLGTAVTPEHLKLLSRHIERLYVIFDGDKAGQEAMIRLTQMCWNVNIELKVVVLPPDQDPASYLQQHETLADPLRSAQDIFSYFISRTTSGYPRLSLKQKLARIAEVLQVLASIEDELKQAVLLQVASQQTGLSVEVLDRSLHRVRISSITDQHAQKSATTIELPLADQQLIAACINEPTEISRVIKDPIMRMVNALTCDILERLNDPAYWDGQTIRTAQAFMGYEEILHQIQTNIRGTPTIASALAAMYRIHFKQLSSAYRQEISQAQLQNNKQRVDELLTSLQELKTLMMNQGAL